MALIASLLALSGAALFCLVCAGLGHRLVGAARVSLPDTLERLLCCTALGVITYQTLLAILEFITGPHWAVILSLAALATLGVSPIPRLLPSLIAIFRRIAAGSRLERVLAAATGSAALFAALCAMAPLTGSDALHYHFTSQQLLLRDGFVPHFSLVNSFFAGQGHLLILTGLALHSEKVSLALILAGGLLAAAGSGCLARHWLSREWAWLCSLTFILTPVAFWQMSTSGAPDVWMAFFVTMGVLLVARANSEDGAGIALLAGVFAGALAGAKYTGCFFAAALLLAFVREARALRPIALFSGAALLAGIWPYARNTLWTHDPVFPFLLHWFTSGHLNSYTLAAVLADTGAGASRSFSQGLLFPLFAGIDPSHAGFWQFFGPLPFAFVVLIVFAFANTPLWRAAGIVWCTSALLVFFSSAMLRFLLPVFPIALAAAFAGVHAWHRRDWRFARALALASIAALLSLCAGGVLLYGRLAAAAATGWLSPGDYLSKRAPDDGKISFINRTLAGREEQGSALVFFRHLYYLRIPFVSGNPDANWGIDPQTYSSAQTWQAFFRAENIRWVVRAPDYPPAIAAPLLQLERDGWLIPIASEDVSDVQGLRILDDRRTTAVVILRVKD